MNIFKLWLPVIIWAGAIFWLSSIPNLKTGLEYDFILRKVAHVVEYSILTLLLYRAFKGSCTMGILYSFVYPASISFLYAVSDEFHQSFVPGRSAAVRDVLIDSIGIVGFYIMHKALRMFVDTQKRQVLR